MRAPGFAVGLVLLCAVSAWGQATERRWDAGGGANDWNITANWEGDLRPDTASEGATVDLSLTAADADFPVRADLNTTIGFLKVNTPGKTGVVFTQNRTLEIVNSGTTSPGGSPTATTNVDGTVAVIGGTLSMSASGAILRLRGADFTLRSGDATPTNGFLSMSDGRVEMLTNANGVPSRIISDVPFGFPPENTANQVTRGFSTLHVPAGQTGALADNVRIRIWRGDDIATGAIEGMRLEGTLNGGNNTIIETAGWGEAGIGISGTFNPGTSTVIFTGNVTINGGTFYNLVIRQGTAVLSAVPRVLNNLIVESGGTLDMTSQDIVVGGSVTINGTLVMGGGRTIFINTQAENPGVTTHTITGSGTVSIRRLNMGSGGTPPSPLPAQTFNIDFAAGNTLAIQEEFILNPTMTLNTFTSRIVFESTVATINLAGTANFSNIGGSPQSKSTVVYRRAADLPTISGGSANPTWFNLIIDHGTAVNIKPGAVAAVMRVENDFTLQSGNFNDGSAITLEVGRHWINNGGTFNAGASSTVRMINLASPSRILDASSATAQTFANLQIGDGTADVVSLAPGKNVTVTATLTVFGAAGASAAFNLGSGQLTVGTISYGSYTPSSIDHGTSTVIFNGTTLPDDETWYNLTIDGVSVAVAADGPDADSISDVTVVNNLVINSTRTLAGGSATFLVGADWTNNGSFTAGTSTVELNSGAAGTLGGSSATTFNVLRVNKSAAATLVTVATGFTCNASLTLVRGRVNVAPSVTVTALAGATIGEAAPADGTTNATLQLGAGSQLKLGNATRLTVQYTGKLETSGAAPTIAGNTGTDAYIFEVFGRINTAGLNVAQAGYDAPATTGADGAYGIAGTGSALEGGLFIRVNPSITVGTSPNVEALNNVRFSAVTTRALWIHVPSGGYTVAYTGHVFDFAVGSAVTVRFTSPDTATSRTITMLDAQHPSGTAGAANGEANDEDASPHAVVTWENPVFWQYQGVSAAWDWTSGGNTNWRKADGTIAPVPGITHAVKIDSADPDAGGPLVAQTTFPTIPNGVAAAAGSLELRNSASLTMASGAPQATLRIKGTFTVPATATFTAGNGRVIFGEGVASDVPQTIPDLTYWDLEVANINPAEVPTASSTIVQNDLIVDTGAVLKSVGLVTVRRHLVLNGTGSLSPQTGSVFVFDGTVAQELQSDQPSKTFDFRDVTVSNPAGLSVNTASAGTVNMRTLTINAGATVAGGGHTFVLSGDLVLNGTGTFSPGTSTFTFRNTAAAQQISVNTAGKIVDFYNLKIESKASAGGLTVVNTAAGAVTTTIRVASNIEIGQSAVPDAALDYSGGADDTVLIEVRGSWLRNQSATLIHSGRSEVHLTGTGAQSVSSSAFNILRVNRVSETAGTSATLNGGITAYRIIVQEGTLDLGSGLSHTVTFAPSAGTGNAVTVEAGGTLRIAGSATTNTTLIVRSNRDGSIAGNAYLLAQSGSALRMFARSVVLIGVTGGGTKPLVLIEGTFQAEGSPAPLFDDETPSTAPHYGLAFRGATLNVLACEFKNYRDEGITLGGISLQGGISLINPASISNSNGPNRIDKMLFRGNPTSAPTADLYVNWSGVAGTLEIEMHDPNFESSININDINNTLTSTAPKRTITVFNPAGTTGSSDFELDPGNDGIFWIGTKIWAGAEVGAGAGTWNDANNWSPVGAPTLDFNIIIPDIVNGGPGTNPRDLENCNGNPGRCRSLKLTYGTTDGGKMAVDTSLNEVHCLADLMIEDGALLRVGYTETGAIADNSAYLLVQGHWIDNTVYGPGGNANIAWGTNPAGFDTNGFQQYASTTATNARVLLTGIGKSIFGSTRFANLQIGGPQPQGDADVNASGWDIALGNAADIKIGHPSGANARLVIKLGAKFRGGSNATQAKLTMQDGSVWTQETGAGNLDWDPGNSLVVWLNADGNTGIAGNQLPNNRPTAGESYFYDLQIGDGTTAVTVTLDRPLRVRRNLTIKRNATLNVGTNALIVGGNLTVEGQLGATPAGTISFGAGQTTTFGTDNAALPPAAATWQVSIPDDNGDGIPNFSFQNVTVNDLTATVGQLELLTNVTVSGAFTTNENVKLNANTLRLQGAISVTGGTLVYDTGTFFLDQAAALADQSIPYSTFYNLTVSGGNTYFLGASTTVLNDVRLEAGILDVDADGVAGGTVYNLNIGRSFTRTGGTLEARVGTASVITFDGTAGPASMANNAAGTLAFNTLTINKGAAATLTYSSSASASFSASALNVNGGTFDVGAGFAHSVSGALSVGGGTLVLNTSTMTAGSASVSAGTLDMTNATASATDSELLVSGAFTLSGGSLNMGGATVARLEVQGGWTHSGGTFTVGSDNVRLSGGAATIVTLTDPAADFYNLEISSTAAKTAGSTILVSNNLRMLAGAFDTAAQTVRVDGSVLNDGGAAATVSIGTGVLDANGAIQGTGVGSALSISFAGAGRLEWSGTTFDLNGGTFTAGTGTFRFDRTAGPQPMPVLSYNHVEIANGTGAGVAVTPAGTLTIGGNLVVGVGGGSGTFSLGANTVTVSGGVSGTGGKIIFNAASSILNTNGTFDSSGFTLDFAGTTGRLEIATGAPVFGTVIAPNGTIRFDGAVAQTVPTSISYYTLELQGATMTTAAGGTLTVTNLLRQSAGTFSPSATTTVDTAGVEISLGTFNAPATMTVSGNWTHSGGTFAPGTGTVTFDGTTQTLSISGGTHSFNNLAVGPPATSLTVTAGTLSVGGTLTVAAGALLDLGAGVHTITGTSTINGTLDLEGSGATFAEYVAKANFTVAAGGQLSLRNLGRLRAGGTGAADPGIVVAIHGTLFTPSGAATRPEIIKGTSRFNFYIAGTCNVNGLVFSGAQSDATSRGFEVRSGATLTALNKVDFLDVAKPGVHLNLLVTASMAPGTFTISQCAFDTSYHPNFPNPVPVASDPQVPDFVETATNAIVATADTATNQVDILMSACKWVGTLINLSPLSGNQQDFDFASGSTTDAESDTTSATNRVVVRWKRAYVWTGGGANALWSNPANWDSGAVPPTTTAGDVRDIIIPAGTPQNPQLDQNAVGITLSVENGKLVTVATSDAATSYTLTLQGNLDLQDATPGDGTTGGLSQAGEQINLVFDFSSAQTISRQNADAALNVNNVTVTVTGTDNNRTVTASSGFTMTGTLTIAEDTFRVATGVTVTVNGALSIEAGGTLNLSEASSRLNVLGNVTNAVGGAIDFGASGTGTLRITGTTGTPFANSGVFAAGNGTVEFMGAAGADVSKSVPALSYWNLVFVDDNDTPTEFTEVYTMSGNTIVQNITIEADTQLDTTTGNWTLEIRGDFTKSGSFLRRNGTVLLNGSGAQTFSGSIFSFWNLTVSKSAGTATAGALFGVGNRLRVDSGTLDLGTPKTIDVDSGLADAVLVTGTGTLNINQCRLNVGTTTLAGGVQVDASATLRIPSEHPGQPVELDVAGNVVISGTLDLSSSPAVINVAGNWTNNPGSTITLTSSTATVVFDKSAAGDQVVTTQNAAGGDFVNVTIGATGVTPAVRFGSSVRILGTVTFASGTLGKLGTVVGDITIRVGGSWTDGDGAADNFVEGGTIVRFTGTGTVSAETFNAVEMDTTGTVTASGRLVMASLTFLQGTLNLGTGITSPAHSVTGAVAINPGAALSATLDMNTSALTVGAGLSLGTGAGTATVTITSDSAAAIDLDVTGDLTIGANGTLNGSGSAATIRSAGNWSDSGTFNVGSTTVILSGAAKTITVPNSTTSQDFYHLTVSGTLTATAGLDIVGNLLVKDGGTLTLQNASALTHEVEGRVTIEGGATGGKLDLKNSILRMATPQGVATLTFHVQSGTVRGELIMDDNSQLLFANNHRILVEGKLTCDADGGASDPAEPKITRLNVGDRYEIELKGALNVGGLNISYYTSNGVQITGTDGVGNTIAAITFNDVDFRNAVSGGVHLKLGSALTGTRIMTLCSFDSSFGAGGNVQQLASSPAVVTFTQFGGAGGGEDFDIEWTTNNIRWSRTFYWVGAAGSNWFDAGNWSFSSGGAGGAGVPGLSDVAVIDDVNNAGGFLDPIINNPASTAEALDVTIKQDDPAKAGQGGDLTVQTNAIFGNTLVEGTTSANTGFLRINITDTTQSLNLRGNLRSDGGGIVSTAGLVKFDGGNPETSPQEILSTVTLPKVQIQSWVKLKGAVELTTTATTDALVVANGSGLILHKTVAGSAPGLKFASGGQARILGSFKALSDFGTDAPRPLVTRSGAAGTIDFNLGEAADPADTIDVRSLAFSYGDVEGLNIVADSSTVWSSFDGVAFTNASTRHLTITAHGGRVDSPNSTFDATGTVNVRVDDPAPAPDRFTIVLVTSNDAAAAPGKGEGRDEDINTGNAAWVAAAETVTTNPGSESNTPERKGLQGGILMGLNSTYGYGLVGQGTPSAPADDKFVVIATDPASPNFGKIVASQTFDRTIYGEIVGRPLVLPVDTNDDGTADADDIVFGTTTARVVRLRYNGTTLSTMNDVAVPGPTTITGPLASDITWKPWPWGTTAQSTSNIFFAGLGGATPKFYGVQYTSPGTAIAGFPVTLAAPSYTEPTISELNVSGLGTDEYIFFSTIADASGVSHFYRIKATGGLDLHEYSGSLGPDSDAVNPVWEFSGVLGIGTTIQRRRINTTTTTSASFGATTISVADTSAFPAAPSNILIGDEPATYTAKTATTFTLSAGLANAHSSGTSVYHSAGTARAYLMSSTSGGGLAASAGWPVAATGTGNTGTETGIAHSGPAPVVWGQNNGIVHARNLDGTPKTGFPLTVDSGAKFTTFPQAPVTTNEYYMGTTSGRVWKVTISPAGSTLVLDLGPGSVITNIQPTFTHLVIGTQSGRVYFIPYP